MVCNPWNLSTNSVPTNLEDVKIKLDNNKHILLINLKVTYPHKFTI